MTGENPVSWLAQFVFINLYVYLKTGLSWPVDIGLKLAQTSFQKLIFLHFANITLKRAKISMMSMKLARAAWNWHYLLFHLPTGKENLVIRLIFSLVDMITNTKFSDWPNVFRIGVVQQ